MIVTLGPSDYGNVVKIDKKTTHVKFFDHMGGFDKNLTNTLLDTISNNITTKLTVETEYILSDSVISNYPGLNFKFDLDATIKENYFFDFFNYNIHPDLNYKNFICSFNGSAHVSRKLLVSILEKFGYYNPKYCSKNFSYSIDALDGHINDYVPDQIDLYRKFFISADGEDFFQTVNSFGHVRYEHNKNIYKLENKLTESFLHIVSETMATSYYPFVTEKFLYSIVTRGLFLSYAQPGYHAHIEKYYGFKLYTKLFDYKFDSITNPVKRLVELMTMIGKFDKLTPFEWHDLYLLEKDNIEFNYDHYFSKNYLIELKKYEN
jgi:hypothetical protein